MKQLVILFTIYGFIFGIIFGSFTNAVVYRLKKKISIVRERSMCPNCKHQLRWYDLFPIISFLVLKGRCRDCKTKISFHYPLIELITGIFIALITYQLVTFRITTIEYLFQFVFIINMIVVLSSDTLYQKIWDRNQLINFVAIMGLVIIREQNLLTSLVSGILAAVAFFGIFKLTGEGEIGFGDVKLAFGIAFLFQLISFLYITILSTLSGVVIGYIMSRVAKKNIRDVLVPLGSIISFISIILLILENITSLSPFFN